MNSRRRRDGDPARAACQQISELLGRVDTALIGPGLMDETAAEALARCVLERADGPGFVIDAMSIAGLWDAQRILARHSGKLVITPHAGEMARLTGLSKEEVCAEPLRVARDVAAHLGCLVVMKGADTYIAQPDGLAFLHEGGVVGLATAGSGDVLAGVIAGLMARGTSVQEAALWGVFLHAQAGRSLSRDVGALGFLSRELLVELPKIMHSFQPPEHARV